MSDTPLTAKAKIACGFQAVPDTFLEFASKLERENAALREDKERLDSGEIMLMISDRKWLHVGRHKVDLRAAIDAARKEAKP